MKILIAGAGAMGSFFGAYLSNNNEVMLLTNHQKHIDKVKKDGLIINDTIYKINIDTYSNIKDKYDLIILFPKAYDLEKTIKEIKINTNSNTKILCLLNGLGHKETLLKYYDKDNIYLGITTWASNLVEPGKILLSGEGKIEFQNLGNKDNDVLNNVLNEANLNSKISNNIIESIWNKVVINATYNPLCTILNMTMGQLSNTSMELIISILDEIIECAKLDNVTLNKEYYLEYFKKIGLNTIGHHYPSMYQDIKNKRQTEIEYLNGYIYRKGLKNNLNLDINKTIYLLIKSLEKIIVK